MPDLEDFEKSLDKAIDEFLELGGNRTDVLAALEMKAAGLHEELGQE